jgi:hypothetical protein
MSCIMFHHWLEAKKLDSLGEGTHLLAAQQVQTADNL